MSKDRYLPAGLFAVKRHKKLLAVLFALCLFLGPCAVRSLAADGEPDPGAEPYTYKVTFYAGNQGVFAGVGQIGVVDEDNRPVPAQVSLLSDGSAIVVEGLKAGDTVIFDDIQGGAVALEQNSQYYVRGLRKSGYDNETTAQAAFQVEQDQDYVVAYGIRGDMVSYVIQYQDAAGNTLADSRTYYGNVGDRPVVAFLYIEGYEPQAYNLTKTLSKNEAENVFTFVYAPVAAGGAAEIPEESSAAETSEAAEPVPGPGGAVPAPGGAADESEEESESTGESESVGESESAGGDVEIDDANVPLVDGPEDLVDLDEERVPLAPGLSNLDEFATNMLGAVVVSVTGVAALVVLLLLMLRRRKKALVKNDPPKDRK